MEALPPAPKSDPELVALPTPRRPWQRVTLVVLALTAVCSVAAAVALLPRARYALGDKKPIDIGALSTRALAGVGAERWVRGTGSLTASAVSYRRPLESDEFRLARVEGEEVWVELRVPREIDQTREGLEEEYYVPPTSFVGRAVPFRAAGPGHDDLIEAIAGQSGVSPAQGAWLVVDGESPRASSWAVLVVAVFFAFAAFCVFGIVRLTRPAHFRDPTSTEAARG